MPMATPTFSQQIPGAAVTKQYATVTSPFDEREVGCVEVSSEAGVEQALANAYVLFKDRKQWLPAEQRIGILEKTAELMQARFDELVQVALSEGGKPLQDSRVEVTRAIEGIRNCVDCMRTESGKEIPMGINAASANRLAFTTHEPIGVVVAVSAFNHRSI